MSINYLNKIARLCLAAFTAAICSVPAIANAEHVTLSHTQHSKKAKVQKQKVIQAKPQQLIGPYRGWGFLVEKLRQDGISESTLRTVYQDKRMPRFTDIPFSLQPRETHSMYVRFLTQGPLSIAKSFLDRHKKLFGEAERTFGVSRNVIAAIFLVETQAGTFTGKELVINRLSRLASIAEPNNLLFNYDRLRKLDTSVTFERVKERASYLEETFYPEVKALLEISRRQRIDLLELRGSGAGAFGIPQFLPSSYLRFGVDANRDGLISLFHESDAIWSTANYLSSMGWNDASSTEDKQKVIWKYNHSQAYVDTVLSIADRLSGY
ncbi:MAG: lytic murein transglycosylase [Oligoflexia bacterium]|nr:lytic murein transglycosylase [Oligoflexia bacterium]